MNRHVGRWILGGGLALVGACVLRTETLKGPEGEPGEAGPPGETTVTLDGGAVVSLQQLADRVAALEAQLQAQADPACPAGYAAGDASDAGVMGFVVCHRGVDEVVKVGTGGSAFWIDRYEASLWAMSDGSGTQFGIVDGDADVYGFHRNGQRDATFKPVYALSRYGVTPSAWVTWFQANEACRLSDKRLPTPDEWLAAATGTPDPTASDPGTQGGNCVTGSNMPRITGGADVGSLTACISAHGAQDMIGNLWEWTAEWYAGLGNKGPADPLNATAALAEKVAWPYGNGDATYNIASSAYVDPTVLAPNVPAASMRGGAWSSGTKAGVFTLALDGAPSAWNPGSGFRCVVPR